MPRIAVSIKAESRYCVSGMTVQNRPEYSHKHAWKLSDSIDDAKSSAIIYRITETAKANSLSPFRYLEYVLTVMKDHQEDTDYCFMEELLPWSKQLPENCRSKAKTITV